MPVNFNAKENLEILKKAFPEKLSRDVEEVVKKLETPEHNPSYDIGPVRVLGEKISIPFRIYTLKIPYETGFSQTQKLIIQCLFTRHYNGFTRQKFAERISNCNEAWVIPFVAQLVGEYVVEIIQQIDHKLTNSTIKSYQVFVDENPYFCQLTTRRIISYWHCYYRSSFDLPQYPGYKVAFAMGIWCDRLTNRV